VWYSHRPTLQTFALRKAPSGVIAIRVWLPTLLSQNNRKNGGLTQTPLIGSPTALATAQRANDYEWLRSIQLTLGLDLLYTLVALVSLAAWVVTAASYYCFGSRDIASFPDSICFSSGCAFLYANLTLVLVCP